MSRFLFFVSCALLIFVSKGAADDDDSDGDTDVHKPLKPPRCGGPLGKKCICFMSKCTDGRCVCQAPFTWGNGAFNCYKEDTVAAELKNDPALTTFSNETVPFPYPCRYLVTHVRQDLRNKRDEIIGHCEFKVNAFNARMYGKMFVLGFDVAAKIKYEKGKTAKLSSRNFGVLNNDRPRFRFKGTLGEFLPDGPWKKNKIGFLDAYNGVRAKLDVDEVNKRVYFEVPKCGFKVVFVPYDVQTRREQFRLPGLAVSVEKSFNPQWYSNETVMALTPSTGGESVLAAYKLKGLTKEESMVVRAFTSGVEQNQPHGASDECVAVGDSFKSCSPRQRKKAVESCYWMLEEPRFMRCYDNSTSSKELLKLFSSCVDVWCNKERSSCRKVKRAIKSAKCDKVPRIPQLERYLSGELCPEL